MIRPLSLFTVLACTLIAPAAALARDGDRPRFPDRRIEAADVQPSPETTEQPTVPANDPETKPAPVVPGDDGETTSEPGKGRRGDGAGLPGVPELTPAFLRRVWRFSVEADGYDAGAHVLSATVDRVLGGPKRARRALADVDVAVLVTPATRVLDADGNRVAADGLATALDDANDAVVTGKPLAKAKWQQDEDGDPVPTLRAKRIAIED